MCVGAKNIFSKPLDLTAFPGFLRLFNIYKDKEMYVKRKGTYTRYL